MLNNKINFIKIDGFKSTHKRFESIFHYFSVLDLILYHFFKNFVLSLMISEIFK